MAAPLASPETSPAPRDGNPHLLHGIRVLELCSFVAGPYCARLLGDLGAEVIKIEHPRRPDEARARGPHLEEASGLKASAFFIYFNVNKLGVSLDIAQPDGAQAFRELVSLADVLVEDRPLGELDALGFGLRDLHRVNPALVVTSISPFGRSGPRAACQVAPLAVFHAGGEGYSTPMGACPSPRSAPTQIGRFVGERYAALCAAAATLSAVIESRATGEGEHVDVSKQHVLPFLFQREMLYYLVAGRFPTRHTRPHKVGGTLRCKDGYICIMPRPESWPKLLELMGNPEEMEPYRDWGRARAAGESVNRLLEQWLGRYSREHLFRALQRVGLSAGPCLSVAEAADCEQFAARGLFGSRTQTGLKSVRMPLVPYQIGQARPAIERAAPEVGEHDELIYGGLLGYPGSRIARLRKSVVIAGDQNGNARVRSRAGPGLHLGCSGRALHQPAGMDGRPGHKGGE
ncbi:MAG: CoA transferase [Chloroflexi bacterium]|nr:CoA transferase [Chloroflexota bacterium]